MPRHWTIEPQQKLVPVVAKGEVVRADFEAVLDGMKTANAHGYRKLFDGEFGGTRMTSEEAMAVGVRMRAEHGTGPLAVVLPEKYAELAGHVLGMLASADRPMRVFGEITPARR